MSCKCQGCGAQYKVDLLVSDDAWERIKPAGKTEGAGLLCGSCIMQRIEGLGQYGALQAVEPQSASTNNAMQYADAHAAFVDHICKLGHPLSVSAHEAFVAGFNAARLHS